LDRQSKDQERERIKENEDPDEDEILERDRKKKANWDDWKDDNPAGSGNTKFF
jgi:hypothetical protein